jgi:hypothetical protein
LTRRSLRQNEIRAFYAALVATRGVQTTSRRKANLKISEKEEVEGRKEGWRKNERVG